MVARLRETTCRYPERARVAFARVAFAGDDSTWDDDLAITFRRK
jgi:hypothetical protein